MFYGSITPTAPSIVIFVPYGAAKHREHTEDGRCFEFKAGDAAYFPPRTHGTWTIHETLRKTYCIWRLKQFATVPTEVA